MIRDRKPRIARDDAWTMTRSDGDLSPPFEIVEPAHWRAPIIFNSPHSGSAYPDEFLSASRIDLHDAAPVRRFLHGRVDRGI